MLLDAGKVLGIGEIRHDDCDRGAVLFLNFLGQRRQAVGPACDENEIEAAGGQTPRVYRADPGRSSRHDRDGFVR